FRSITALSQRLESKVVPGDPRDENATMGPLVSIEQRDDVASAVHKLIDAGGEVVYGGADKLDCAFFAPTIVRFDDAEAEAVHSVEAFGPVVSVIGYDEPTEAVELADKEFGRAHV